MKQEKYPQLTNSLSVKDLAAHSFERTTTLSGPSNVRKSGGFSGTNSFRFSHVVLRWAS